AEVLEGAEDVDAVRAYLSRYGWQGIHRIQAETAARLQRRTKHRLGENDAWQAAVAEGMKARVAGHDDAFKRLAAGYEDYRPEPRARALAPPRRSEPPALKVDERLLQFLARAHDEGAVPGDGLAQRPARDQDRPRGLAIGTGADARDADLVPLAQHRELVGLHGLGARIRADAYRALEHVQEPRVVRRQ